MKKIISIVVLSTILIFWCNTTFALKEWQKGVITERKDTTITVNRTTYDIDSNTIIMDEEGNSLPIDALGQKTCCDHVRILVRDNSYIEKIIVDTSKAVE